MVHIPDVIISKPRKFAHDFFSGLSVLALIIAALNLLAGKIGAAVLFGILMLVFVNIASKIKFKWVLRGGGGVYE